MRGGLQGGVADAVVEPNPIDAISATVRVAVAELNAPMGRMGAGDIFQGPLHCDSLLRHALGLPLAAHADVECDGVIENGTRVRITAGCKGRQGPRGGREYPPHPTYNDTAAKPCRKSPACRLWPMSNKRKAAAPKRRRRFPSSRRQLLAERVRNVVEGRIQLVADALHRANGRNSYKS